MHTTHILYRAAGEPLMDGDAAGMCRFCGLSGLGLSFAAWVRDTFTDHDRLLPGDIICHACQFAFDEASSLLTLATGRDKLQRMRNYSHFVVRGEWLPLNKGEKDGMVAALARQPEVAIIAVSGQKHLIFRAQAGWWQIEEQSSPPFPDVLWPLLATVELLYSGGFSKGEIETGRYYQHRLLEFGLDRYLALEALIAPARGTLPLELALFLAQRRELDDDGRLPAGIPYSAETAHSALARRAGRLQATVREEHLAAVRGQPARGGLHEQPEQVRQLGLFAAADPDSEQGRGGDK